MWDDIRQCAHCGMDIMMTSPQPDGDGGGTWVRVTSWTVECRQNRGKAPLHEPLHSTPSI